MSGFLRRLVDAIAPPLCPICDRRVSGEPALCSGCWRQVGWITPPYCDRLGTPLPFAAGEITISPAAFADPPPWNRARAAARYDAISGGLIRALKYRDRPELASLIGRLMTGAGRDILEGADTLIPVPLARGRLLTRQFNQAALLARAISAGCGVPVVLDALRRRTTSRQVGLGRQARLRNVARAFHVPAECRESIEGRVLVLVDDVLTTGATATAATRVLLSAGAARVEVLVFARVVRD